MLAIAKTPRIDLRIEGEISQRVLATLEEEYGDALSVSYGDNDELVKMLETALIEGENSGEPGPFDFDAFKTRKRAEYERE